MKRKYTHRPQSVPNKRDDVITVRLNPIDSTIKPLCAVNYTIPKAWLDELKLKESDKKEPFIDERDITIEELRAENAQLTEQLEQQKRCCELLNDLFTANNTNSKETPTDLVDVISREYILQPAPRGYVMINSSDLQGRTQHTSIAPLIRLIHEIHPDLELEKLTRSICKQLTRNDGAVFNEFYIIRA